MVLEIWNEPGRFYWDQAMDELGLTGDDLEEVAEDPFPFGGIYPNMEAVYRKAWELRFAEEEDDAGTDSPPEGPPLAGTVPEDGGFLGFLRGEDQACSYCGQPVVSGDYSIWRTDRGSVCPSPNSPDLAHHVIHTLHGPARVEPPATPS